MLLQEEKVRRVRKFDLELVIGDFFNLKAEQSKANGVGYR